VIRTPIQAPNANAFAERWLRTLRSDCLDRILILGRRHLTHVLRVDRVGCVNSVPPSVP
jgi:putative transposase